MLMNNRTLIVSLLVVLGSILLSSCDSNKIRPARAHYSDDDVAADVKRPLSMKEAKYDKENRFSKVQINIEYPTDDDAVSSNIRSSLLEYLHKAVLVDEENKVIKTYGGENSDVPEAVEYYGEKMSEALKQRSSADHKVRQETIKEMAAENGEKYDAPDVMQYYYDIEIEKEWETENYCTFDIEVESFLGGAHGSSVNLGGLTISKKDGKLFKAFLKPSSAKALQPLLRKGLIAYFVKDGMVVDDDGLNDILQIEGNIIPLPQETPYPTEEGLVFRYGQYEIAPYAAGKPKVCVPYKEIKPFLTAEAIALLGL